MYFYREKDGGWQPQFGGNASHTTTVLKGAAAAVITIPAHGFVLNKAQVNLAASAPATAAAASPAMGWLKTFFGACVWAAMIAAGSLVYSHFVGKWQQKGYPILPVAAMTAAGGGLQPSMQPSIGGAIPLGGSTLHQPAPNQRQEPSRTNASRQTSFLDEFEG